MTLRAVAVAAWLAVATAPLGSLVGPATPDQTALSADLDRIFADPLLARALMAVRVDRVDGGTLYAKNAEQLVMPASNMKIFTVATAATRLGWGYRYETRLETAGPVDGHRLNGSLIVIGSGDPSIESPDGGHASLFLEWADTVRQAGILRVDRGIVGDDRAFEDERLGAGWAWDYVGSGYAAPTGALNYNDNAASLRIAAGAAVGAPATVIAGPPGHGLNVMADVTTGAAGTTPAVQLQRFPGDSTLRVHGTVPLSPVPVIRSAAVNNPTLFFVEGLRLALVSRGIEVDRALDIGDLPSSVAPAPRRSLAVHRSLPLSVLAGYAMKESQNQWAEVLLKTLGRSDGRPGSAAAGRQVVLDTLRGWGVPSDAIVMYDGSGLSRYNYTTASSIVMVLTRMWNDERMRGPFVAMLPVGARDGSLELRMRDPALAANVRAKTGTISNVRALSGYVTTTAGDTLVFSMIANHFTATNAQIDAIVERALARLVAAATPGA